MKEAINKGKSSNKGPCGACKFLRRKCVNSCVFAPYFSAEDDDFAAVHKVFGASNASKLLLRLPPHARPHAVLTLSYQARARINDPVYGCVAHIFSLQQQVVNLQAKVAFVHAQLSTMQRNPATPFPRSPIAQYSSANLTSDMTMMPSSDVSMHLTSSTPMSVFSPLVQELHRLDLEALGNQPLKSLYSAPTSD